MIRILMNPHLPEKMNQSIDVVIAALFISHKLHESSVVPVRKLCCGYSDSRAVLAAELTILKSLKFRVAQPLLIEDCFETAHKWDQFTNGLSCIDIKFFPK
jgi:hypothetical protein